MVWRPADGLKVIAMRRVSCPEVLTIYRPQRRPGSEEFIYSWGIHFGQPGQF